MDTWSQIKADRESLAGYLSQLTAADWDAKSWCDAWSIKDVAAHLLVPPTMSKGQVFLSFLKAGFNLNKMSDTLVKRMTSAMSTEQVVDTMRSTAGSRSAPPGLKPVGVLSELLVHASDVSLALGKPLQLPVDHYVVGLDHMKNVQPVMGCKRRIAGLQLKATDTAWSTGEGPLVEGDAQHLLSAMTGRKAALDSLRGDGVEVMHGR